MKYDWSGLLLSLWRFLNSHEGGKLFLGVVFLGPLVYAMAKLLTMPNAPPRTTGTKHTTSIVVGRDRSRIRALGICVAIVNVVTLALYVRVWLLMPEKADRFPRDHNAAAVWAGCLIAGVLTVILLAIFVAMYKNVDPKS
jgi:hypothetical protein